MITISKDLIPKLAELKQRLESVEDPSKTLATTKAEVRLIETQHSIATTRGFEVIQDEPASIAGGGRGPAPTDYFAASIGFCENVVFVRHAAMAGLSIESLETSVNGVWDVKGLFDIGGADSSYKTITVETKVTTKDPIEKVVEVARMTHKRCPIHATLRKSTQMIFKLFVNGQPVPL